MCSRVAVFVFFLGHCEVTTDLLKKNSRNNKNLADQPITLSNVSTHNMCTNIWQCNLLIMSVLTFVIGMIKQRHGKPTCRKPIWNNKQNWCPSSYLNSFLIKNWCNHNMIASANGLGQLSQTRIWWYSVFVKKMTWTLQWIAPRIFVLGPAHAHQFLVVFCFVHSSTFTFPSLEIKIEH